VGSDWIRSPHELHAGIQLLASQILSRSNTTCCHRSASCHFCGINCSPQSAEASGTQKLLRNCTTGVPFLGLGLCQLGHCPPSCWRRRENLNAKLSDMTFGSRCRGCRSSRLQHVLDCIWNCFQSMPPFKYVRSGSEEPLCNQHSQRNQVLPSIAREVIQEKPTNAGAFCKKLHWERNSWRSPMLCCMYRRSGTRNGGCGSRS